MADKTTLFERIKEFVLMGYDNNQIAEYLNISPDSGYIRRVRREVTKPTETPSNSPILTPRKYYKLLMENKGTKEELAAELGCSRMWLHKFEKSTEVNRKVAEYLYIRGMTLSQIAKTLGAKKHYKGNEARGFADRTQHKGANAANLRNPKKSFDIR